LVRKMADLDSWICAAWPQPNLCLADTRAAIWTELRAADANVSRSLLLPISCRNSRKVPYTAGEIENLSKQTTTLSADAEKKVIETLVTEINRNYCLNLADDVIVARGGGLANMGISAGNIAMIGASHTRLISDSSAASRIKIIKGLPSWTSDEQAVTEISSALSLAGLSEKDCVYFDLFSNSTFLGTDERGLPAEPEQDEEGAWHLRGTLDVAPVRSLQRIARMAVDLVAAAGAVTVIMGLPLARYVAMPCCNDESHVENYGARDFETTLRAGVAAVREALESALLGSNKTVIYLDPHTVFGGETLRDLAASGGESIWCEDDCVHLTQAA
jgi:hypothetical protein